MAKKGVSVGVKIDGDAKGFKSASEDAQKATQKLQQTSKRSGTGIQATFRKITMAMGPIALAIGAVVGAFKGLKSIISGSVAGQERLASVMGYLRGVMDGVKDVAIDVSEWLIKAFEDPQQAVSDLWEVIKQNFINRFKGLVDMVVSGWNVISQGAKGVGLAIAGIFSDEKRQQSREAFAEMRQGMADFGHAALQAITGVEDVIEKVTKGVRGLGKQLSDRAKEMQALAQREFALRQQRAADLTTLARLEADIANARRQANDDAADLTTQIEAQERAMKMVEQRYEIQAAQAREALAIQRERMALGHDTIEDIEKEAQLAAELVNLEKSRDDLTRTMLRRYGTLINQQEALGKKTLDQLEAERKARQDIMTMIEESYMSELELIDRRMQEMVDAHEWSEEEKTRITQYFADKRADILDREAEKMVEVGDTMRSTMLDAAMQVSEAFNHMALSGRASAKEILRQTLATVTALLIKSIMASGLPLFGKLGMAAGASTIAGGLMAAVPKLKDGGIIPPGYPNDTYPALLSSGERVTPPGKLGAGHLHITVDGRLSGRDIDMVLKRYMIEEDIKT